MPPGTVRTASARISAAPITARGQAPPAGSQTAQECEARGLVIPRGDVARRALSVPRARWAADHDPGGVWQIHGRGQGRRNPCPSRSRSATQRGRPHLRYCFVRSAVDGCSRSAYREALDDETATTGLQPPTDDLLHQRPRAVHLGSARSPPVSTAPVGRPCRRSSATGCEVGRGLSAGSARTSAAAALGSPQRPAGEQAV